MAVKRPFCSHRVQTQNYHTWKTMLHYLERALNILVLGVVYIRINVFSLLYWFLVPLTRRYAIKCILTGKGSPYTLIHRVKEMGSPYE